jgi:ATP-binding protein involved in chromosome partitioning
MGQSQAVPHAVTRRDDGVRIDWVQEGHTAFFPARALRLACPCAACVDEMSGTPLLDPAAVPPDVRPLRLSLVGAYGLRIDWSDGHGTGIFTWDRLRGACPCPDCSAARAASP